MQRGLSYFWRESRACSAYKSGIDAACDIMALLSSQRGGSNGLVKICHERGTAIAGVKTTIIY